MFRTVSKIDIMKMPGEILTDVMITGGDEDLAEAILVHAARHALAASRALMSREGRTEESQIVFYDLNYFFTELSFMSAT